MTINGRREGVFRFMIYFYVVFFTLHYLAWSAKSYRHHECYVTKVPSYIGYYTGTRFCKSLIIYGKKYKNHNLKIMSNLHIFLSHRNSQ